ncbi:4'-phosphopantetheinyl transferase family protein [Arthrobacter sp. KK5.5]|uniref:4'-phosphopantetheinyl transferase family protein n=1 Tax=Arthrobacter sp. KK5.5 TaxID=3373084 RepID=UPI003EE42C20
MKRAEELMDDTSLDVRRTGAADPQLLWAAVPLAEGNGLPDSWLGPHERARAAAHLPGAPRQHFVAGRLLVRQLVSRLLDGPLPGSFLGVSGTLGCTAAEFSLVQRCPVCGGSAHGRPALLWRDRPIPVSLSYARAGGHLLVGVAPGGGILGVDLADAEAPAFAGATGSIPLDEYAYSLAERSVLAELPPPARGRQRAAWWVLKEAVGKATGQGITGPDGLPVVVGNPRHPLLDAPGTLVLTTTTASGPALTPQGLPRGFLAAAVLARP